MNVLGHFPFVKVFNVNDVKSYHVTHMLNSRVRWCGIDSTNIILKLIKSKITDSADS